MSHHLVKSKHYKNISKYLTLQKSYWPKNMLKIYCYRCKALTFLSWASPIMRQKGRRREFLKGHKHIKKCPTGLSQWSSCSTSRSLTATIGNISSGGQTSLATFWSSFSSSTATALKCQSMHTCLVLSVSAFGHIVQKLI